MTNGNVIFFCGNGVAVKHVWADKATVCGIVADEVDGKSILHAHHDLAVEKACEFCFADTAWLLVDGVVRRHTFSHVAEATACGLAYVDDMATEIEDGDDCPTCFPATSIDDAVARVTEQAATSAEDEATSKARESTAAAKRESDTSRAMKELVGALEKALGRSRSRNGDVATLRALCLLFSNNPTLLWGDDDTLKKACEIADSCRRELLKLIRRTGVEGPEALGKLNVIEAQLAREYMDVCSSFQLLMDKAKAIADQISPQPAIQHRRGGLILPSNFRK